MNQLAVFYIDLQPWFMFLAVLELRVGSMSKFEKKTLNVILLHDFDFGMIKWKKKKKHCKKV